MEEVVKAGHLDAGAQKGVGADGSSRTGKCRILFHYPVLNRGGAEKSSLRLLKGLVERGHEVHLVLTSPGGILESEIDSRIRVQHLRGVNTSRKPDYSRPLSVIRWGALIILGRMQEWYSRMQFRDLHFDAAITGLTGLSPDFICRNVRARSRFVFVRNDPAYADRSGRWAENIRRHHAKIDGYLCVSRHVQAEMESNFPELVGKLRTIYNLLDPESMRSRAAGPSPFAATDMPNVLSVCRLQEASKALLRMVEVHRRLLDAGVAHVWHVLGDGPDRELLEKAVRAAGVQASFILHGAIANPFPWYLHADLVAVLSRHEGLCGVVNEARVLERPVVATRFSGIDEQIESGVNGLIVEQDVEAICEGVTALLRSPALRERLAKGGYPKELLDDEAKIDKLLALMDEDFPRDSGS